MDNPSLAADLVSWVSKRPRPYDEVMEAWRTSCPRLSIWEDVTDHGFVERLRDPEGLPIVRVTDKGLAFLAERVRGSQTT